MCACLPVCLCVRWCGHRWLGWPAAVGGGDVAYSQDPLRKDYKGRTVLECTTVNGTDANRATAEWLKQRPFASERFGATVDKACVCDSLVSAERRFRRLRRLADDYSTSSQTRATHQVNLGNLYQSGTGVDQDAAQAAQLYRLAADQGNSAAQCNLGILHLGGTHCLARNLAEAGKWLCLAARQGSMDAEHQLSMLATWPLSTTGMPVTVAGLAARPELNGRRGTVQQAAATTKPGRLPVLLDGHAKPMSIKAVNLRRALRLDIDYN